MVNNKTIPVIASVGAGIVGALLLYPLAEKSETIRIGDKNQPGYVSSSQERLEDIAGNAQNPDPNSMKLYWPNTLGEGIFPKSDVEAEAKADLNWNNAKELELRLENGYNLIGTFEIASPSSFVQEVLQNAQGTHYKFFLDEKRTQEVPKGIDFNKIAYGQKIYFSYETQGGWKDADGTSRENYTLDELRHILDGNMKLGYATKHLSIDLEGSEFKAIMNGKTMIEFQASSDYDKNAGQTTDTKTMSQTNAINTLAGVHGARQRHDDYARNAMRHNHPA